MTPEEIQAQIDAENKDFETKRDMAKKNIQAAQGSRLNPFDNDKNLEKNYKSQLDSLEKAHKEKIKHLKFELSKANGRVATSYEDVKKKEAEAAEQEKQKRLEEGRPTSFGELSDMKVNTANKMNNDEGVKTAKEQFRNGEISKEELIEAYKKVDPINGENAARQYAFTGSKVDNFKEGITDTDKINEITSGRKQPKEESKEEPDILNMTADYYNGSDITAQDVVNAAKAKGWSEEQTTAYFEKLGGVSDNAKNALASAYGQNKPTGGNKPAPKTEVKPEPKPEAETPAEEAPTEAFNADSYAKEFEGLSTVEKAMRKEEIVGHIEDLKTQIANETDPTQKQALEAQLKTLEDAKLGYDNYMKTSLEDAERRQKEMSGFDNEITRQRAGGMLNYYKKEKNLLKDKLAKAKDAGNEKEVERLEQQMKDLKSEKGFFIADAIGTALSNIGKGIQGKDANTQSQWEQKQGDIIKAETDRWNAHHDEQMKAIDDTFKKRYDQESEQMQMWNELNNDRAAQMQARQLGLLDDTFDAEAAIKLKELFNTKGITDTLSIMSLMNSFGPEELVGQLVASSGLNINSLIKTLGEAANDGVKWADSTLKKVNSFLGTFNKK